MNRTHNPSIEVYYRPAVSLPEGTSGNFSKTPTKPKRFVKHLSTTSLAPFITLQAGFPAATRDDLLLAHTEEYVDGFLRGEEPHASSNGLTWSPAFAESVRYTTGSLCAALEGALRDPKQITHSPTGGFHHAQPWGGGGFCTFSGQVIAALRVYQTQGARGAWIDLDGHFGNSIEDSRKFAPLLDLAIPKGFNINPMGRGAAYLADLQRGLDHVGAAFAAGKLDYIAFAHGADSHEWDMLSGQVTTAQWLEASRMVYGSVREWSKILGRPIPLVTTLFGGYRDDDPTSVLELHAGDLAIALQTLCGVDVNFTPTVKRSGVRGH